MQMKLHDDAKLCYSCSLMMLRSMAGFCQRLSAYISIGSSPTMNMSPGPATRNLEGVARGRTNLAKRSIYWRHGRGRASCWAYLGTLIWHMNVYNRRHFRSKSWTLERRGGHCDYLIYTIAAITRFLVERFLRCKGCVAVVRSMDGFFLDEKQSISVETCVG